MPLPPAFHELARKVNNWGRWGADDEIGTLNLITDDVVRRGVAAARSGRRISLSIPYTSEGPQSGAVPGRINPNRTMIAIHDPQLGDPEGFCSNDDMVVMSLQAATHWDALAHISYAGRMWNGTPPEAVDFRGAHRCGIDKVGALAGRGVLLDVARAQGRERLEAGYPITADDLDEAAEFGKVRIEPGDIVLIRTGQIQIFYAGGDMFSYSYPTPGPVMATVTWFREKDVAAVATDTLPFEAFPGVPEDAGLAVHLLDVVEIGLTQGQNFDLEGLSAACADDGQYDFLLAAPPLPFRRGCGGPCSPVAVK
jgi:kynurenine formamidase